MELRALLRWNHAASALHSGAAVILGDVRIRFDELRSHVEFEYDFVAGGPAAANANVAVFDRTG